MARFLVLAAFGAALSTAAPTNWARAVGIAAAPAAIGAVGAVPAVGAVGYAAPAVVGGATGFVAGPTHVQERVHAGPAVARTHVQHGVVGHRTVQAGSRTVQVGHQYNVAGQSVHQPPAYTVVASPATNQVSHRALPVPAVPVPAPAAAIPPPARNLGPAPLDKVINEPAVGLGRTHTVITPQRTVVQPSLSVNKYQVDVPVPVPTPIEKTVVVDRPVAVPYQVDVPVPVKVAKPYPVHQVKHVVETPVIEKRTYTHVQPVAVTKTVAHVGVAHQAVGVAAAPAAGVIGAGYGLAAAPAGVIAAAPAAGVIGAGYGIGAVNAGAIGYGLAGVEAWPAAAEAVVAAE